MYRSNFVFELVLCK